MKFFKRGPKKEQQPVVGWPGAPQPQTPVRAQDQGPTEEDPLLDDPTEGVELEPGSVAEAKLSIKELRLRKKALQGKKRELAAELAEVRAEWRERQAGRYSTIGLGRGTGGRLIRGMVQGKRQNERMGHVDVVTDFGNRKQEIDDLIGGIDQAILSLERYTLRQAT